MKRPTFFQGALMAAVLGIFASALVAVFIPFVGAGTVIRLVIPAMALCYLLFLFRQSREKTGRVTTLSLWLVMSIAAWWFSPPLVFYLLLHVGAIWLVRSLYFYSGVFPALIDLGLNALSVIVLVWALSRSGSVFLASWCFFLVQSLFVAIPPTIAKSRNTGAAVTDDQFERARRQADAALRQIASQ